jgi:hypothetical protein
MWIKSQPGLMERSNLTMELFRFFKECKMFFMFILFDFCKPLVMYLKIEQAEIKPL